MAVVSGYFNSRNGDRKYNAETMSKYFTGLVSRGVLQNYADKFVVKQSTGMSVIVPSGKAYFSDGKWIENTTDYTVNIDASDVNLNRIDRIVLRKDLTVSGRIGSIEVKKGTPATQPVAPELTNTEDIEELSLATVTVNKMAEQITQAEITNTIPDTSVCGYVTGLIEQVDTSDLYEQYESAYSQSLASGNAAFVEQLDTQAGTFQSFMATSQSQFNSQLEAQDDTFQAWYDQIKNITGVVLLSERKQVITTSEESSDTFNIVIADFNSAADIVNAYVNGIRLTDDEYTVTATKLILAKALSAGQVIELSAIKSTYGGSETA